MTIRERPVVIGAPDSDSIGDLPAVPGDEILDVAVLKLLIDAGLTREHITAALRISEPTFYRRLRALQKRDRTIRCPTLYNRA